MSQLTSDLTTYEVPKIENGPATAATFNKPLIYIQGALNQLSSEIYTNSNKQAVLQWQAPVSSDVTAGNLVYWDTENGLFKKALASTTIGDNGKRIRARTSLVQGLVLAVNSGTQNSAVLLRYGYYKQPDVIEAVIGVGAISGLYYLSASDSGTAVLTPPANLKVPCINYYGDGQFAVLAVDPGVQITESDSIVRSIYSQTLQVSTQQQGRVNIELPQKASVTLPSRASRVVADISNSTVYYTSTVSSLIGGPGIDVQDYSDSGWRIKASVQNHYLAAEDIFLDGTQLSSDGVYNCILFPGTANGPKTVIQRSISYYSSRKPFVGNLNVWTYCSYGVGTCSVTVKWLSFTDGIEKYLGSCILSTSEKLCVSSAIENVRIQSEGMLVAVITSEASGDIYCNKFGFYLDRIDYQDKSDSSSSHASDSSSSSSSGQFSKDLFFDYVEQVVP